MTPCIMNERKGKWRVHICQYIHVHCAHTNQYIDVIGIFLVLKYFMDKLMRVCGFTFD